MISVPSSEFGRGKTFTHANASVAKSVLSQTPSTVDTPPILPVGDALMISDGVEGVVFCALRDKSDATSVSKARQRLANAGIKVLGAVLNGSPNSSFGSAAYYYTRNGRPSARLPAPT